MLNQIDAYQARINEYSPFGPELLSEVMAYYRVGLTFTSNALEGFSYTKSETKVLIEDGLTVGGKPLRDALAVTGHAKAHDHMFDLMYTRELLCADILSMHHFLDGCLENDVAGTFRDIPVFISGSHYPCTKAELVPAAMEGLEALLAQERPHLHPVEFAVQLHKRLVFIHPFAEGNGRVARLIMNTALIQDRYLPIIVPPELRADYLSCLERAHPNDAEYMAFMYQCEIETQREMLRLLHDNEPAILAAAVPL